MHTSQEQELDPRDRTEPVGHAETSDDGPRETGSGYDDSAEPDPTRWRYEEAELAENGTTADPGYYLW